MREIITFSVAFLAVAALDAAINAAAGSAAVATGAHVNGSRITSHALEAGAAAAAIKSAMVASLSIICFLRIGDRAPWLVLFIMLLATLCITVTITIAVCRIVLGDVSRELLLAAVLTALPLWAGEGAIVYHNLQSITAVLVGGQSSRSPFLVTFSLSFLVAWDALAGYTFAWTAQSQGMEICAPKAAAAAGAVYGAVSGVPKLLYMIALPVAALHRA